MLSAASSAPLSVIRALTVLSPGVAVLTDLLRARRRASGRVDDVAAAVASGPCTRRRSKAPLPSASHSMTWTAPPASATVAVAVTAPPGLTDGGLLAWVPVNASEPRQRAGGVVHDGVAEPPPALLAPPVFGKLPFSLPSWASTT